MNETRDKSEKLQSVFPSKDSDYKKWNRKDNYKHHISSKLLFLVKQYFGNIFLLDKVFQDVNKRTKVRFWYKVLLFFGKRDLKVQVRLPQKPNIYYVDDEWYKTGDYYIDPVEIWWSDYGKRLMESWKGTLSVQKPPFDRDKFMKQIKNQQNENNKNNNE